MLPLHARVNLGAMVRRGAPHSPKLQHFFNLTIRLFRVISGHSLRGGLTPLQRSGWCILQPSPSQTFLLWQCITPFYKTSWSKLNYHDQKIRQTLGCNIRTHWTLLGLISSVYRDIPDRVQIRNSTTDPPTHIAHKWCQINCPGNCVTN